MTFIASIFIITHIYQNNCTEIKMYLKTNLFTIKLTTKVNTDIRSILNY